MNEMNELEKQLLSWTLRRPSGGVEQRLFTAAAAAPAQALLPFRLTWLAPVTAALMLTCVLFNQHYAPAFAKSASGPMVAMILSNQSAAAYLPGSVQAEHNNLPANTFESRSARHALARVTFASPAKAND